jgi:hypothetical protein
MADSNVFSKDPNAVLDWRFDWSGWLADAETITSHTVTAATGLTVDSSLTTDDDTSVTAWLSGGTAGTRYTVTCHIVTSASRADDRLINVDVRER